MTLDVSWMRSNVVRALSIIEDTLYSANLFEDDRFALEDAERCLNAVKEHLNGVGFPENAICILSGKDCTGCNDEDCGARKSKDTNEQLSMFVD